MTEVRPEEHISPRYHLLITDKMHGYGRYIGKYMPVYFYLGKYWWGKPLSDMATYPMVKKAEDALIVPDTTLYRMGLRKLADDGEIERVGCHVELHNLNLKLNSRLRNILRGLGCEMPPTASRPEMDKRLFALDMRTSLAFIAHTLTAKDDSPYMPGEDEPAPVPPPRRMRVLNMRR